MQPLTLDQYFALNNKALSRSKIVDFYKCKHYFYRKHILGEIENEKKDCFKTGSAVDDLLAQIENKSKYIVMDGDLRIKANREEKADMEAQGLIVLKPAEYENIMALAISVENTDAYRELKDYERQKLLQMPWPMKNGLFDGITALPDFIKITGTHVDICDLKTANNFKLDHWFYHCKDYGYFDQFALQTIILQSQGMKTFTYKHLVVNKLENINDVHAVIIPNDLVSTDEMMNKIVVIANTTNFDKKNPSWEHAEVLRDPKAPLEDGWPEDLME